MDSISLKRGYVVCDIRVQQRLIKNSVVFIMKDIHTPPCLKDRAKVIMGTNILAELPQLRDILDLKSPKDVRHGVEKHLDKVGQKL